MPEGCGYMNADNWISFCVWTKSQVFMLMPFGMHNNIAHLTLKAPRKTASENDVC